MRVVSLACSNTEILCELGLASCLVGVDDHSDFPAEVVDGLPRVGPDLSPDIEKVAALEPDLVLASLTVPGHEVVIEKLQAAALPFLAPEPTSIGDVLESITQIAEHLGHPAEGAALIARLRDALEPGSHPYENPPSVLVQWWPKPVIAPGRRSWTHDLIVAAGGSNPLANEEVKSRPLTDNEVRELDPDAIVLSWCGIKTDKIRPELIYENPAWKDLAALRKKRVFVVPEAILGRPSPRLVEGLEALRAIIGRLGERRSPGQRTPNGPSSAPNRN